MSATTAVELVALGIAIWAAIQSLPQPLALDWERLFKVALSTVLRGEVEAKGGDRVAWEAAVRGRVLTQSAEGAPADPAVEALLFSHPADLGPAYDPAILAAGLEWDDLASGEAAARQALGRRLARTVWVDLGGGLGKEIAALVPGVRTVPLALPAGDAEAAAALLALAPDAADRLILIAEGDCVLPALRALLAGPLLRDRLAALVSVGGALGTEDARAWLATNFQHDRLDPELNRSIPYLTILAAGGPLARPWADQRLPVPAPSPSGRVAIDVIDLGPLALEALPSNAVAQALAILLAFRLA